MGLGDPDTRPQEPGRSDTERIVGVLRNRVWVIVACLATVTGVALFGSLLQQKEYTATASLLFRDPGFAQNVFGTDFQAQTDPKREAATNVKLVGLTVVAQRTADALGGGTTTDDIKNQIDVSAQGDSDVVSVQATDNDPPQARRVANTFAREFISFRAEADRSKLLAAKRLADRQFSLLSPVEQQGARGQALSTAAEKLGVLASLQTGNAELVQPAELPTAPSAPKTVRNVILGALLGLLLGVGLAFLLERTNRRLRDPGEARDQFRLPIVGTIPRSSAIDSGMAWLPLPEEEAFRTLRAALRYFNVDHDVRSVVVTSSTESEGKSTVALNLARAAASTSRTILVEADLRHPSLAAAQALFPSPGLAELLTHQVQLHQTVQTLEVTSGAGRSNGATRSLEVIVAGQVPPNPAELLESQAMRGLLTDLSMRYEFVVIDTPPTGAVSDAFPLLSQVSGVLVVCRIGTTTRDAANNLRNQLDRLHAPLLGLVANGVKQPRRGGYGYGYYESYYGGAEAEETPTIR